MTSVLVTLEAPQVTLTLKLPAAALVAMGQDQVTAPLASAVASLDALDLAPGRAEREQVAPGEVTARIKAVVPRCAAAGKDVTLILVGTPPVVAAVRVTGDVLSEQAVSEAPSVQTM